MRRILTGAALALALSTFGLTPAAAQEAERAAAVAACAGPAADAGACEAALAAYIAVVEELPNSDDLLAELVVELATAAEPATADLVSDAILVVADAFTDPDRAAAAAAVAGDVATGTLDPGTLDEVASPS